VSLSLAILLLPDEAVDMMSSIEDKRPSEAMIC
jgi:hypothetical protein